MSEGLPSKYHYKVDPITRMFRAVDKGQSFHLSRNNSVWIAESSGVNGIPCIGYDPEDPMGAIENLLGELGRGF